MARRCIKHPEESSLDTSLIKQEKGKEMKNMHAERRRINVTYYPEWFPINDHLAIYQRHPVNCVRACVRSAFQRNSELLCVWSHAVALVMTIRGFVLFSSKAEEDFLHPAEEKLVFQLAFLCGSLCFGFSCIFHIFYCHSQKYFEGALKLDLLGIVIGTQGTWYPWIYYTFYCERITKFILLFLTVTCGAVSSWLLTRPYLLRECMVRQRAGLSAAIFTLIIPIYCLMFYRDGMVGSMIEGRQIWGLISLSFGTVGVIVFCMKIPECWCSGRYDHIISSHSIFHSCAAVCLWLGIYLSMLLQEKRYETGDNCSK